LVRTLASILPASIRPRLTGAPPLADRSFRLINPSPDLVAISLLPLLSPTLILDDAFTAYAKGPFLYRDAVFPVPKRYGSFFYSFHPHCMEVSRSFFSPCPRHDRETLCDVSPVVAVRELVRVSQTQFLIRPPQPPVAANSHPLRPRFLEFTSLRDSLPLFSGFFPPLSCPFFPFFSPPGLSEALNTLFPYLMIKEPLPLAFSAPTRHFD